MTASSHPGPDDDSALSSWERRVLAAMEDDLAASDPRLAREMSRGVVPAARGWWPMSAPATGLLCGALLLLVFVGALVPASSWAVLGIATTLVVVPWLLLAAVEKRSHG